MRTGNRQTIMRLKIYSNFAILFLVIFTSCRGDQNDDMYAKYIRMVGSNDYPLKSDMSWVTPEIRKILIQKAQLAASNPDSNINFGSRMALIELGDKSTIEAYIADYHQGKTGVMPSVQILPYLIDDLYHGSTYTEPMAPGSGITPSPSIMDSSTATMYKILTVYPFFPRETQEWAKHELMLEGLDKGGPDSKANQTMRAWWEHNKDAILSYRYQDATWLPLPNGDSLITTKPTQNTSNSTSTTVAHEVNHEQSSQPTTEAGIPWWIYGIVVLSMGLIGSLWYFLQSKK